jgi:hypothetical protein
LSKERQSVRVLYSIHAKPLHVFSVRNRYLGNRASRRIPDCLPSRGVPNDDFVRECNVRDLTIAKKHHLWLHVPPFHQPNIFRLTEKWSFAILRENGSREMTQISYALLILLGLVFTAYFGWAAWHVSGDDHSEIAGPVLSGNK